MASNKFMMIYNDLSKKIQHNKYQIGSCLPSENDLAINYGVSRETIRKALNYLSQNGYIQKIRGKGSVVLDAGRYDFPVSGLVSFKEVAKRSGKTWSTCVHELTLIQPSDEIKDKLRITDKTYVWKIVRSRIVDGETIILDKDYINQDIIPTLTKETCEDSLYQFIEEDCDLMISFARKEFSVDPITNEDKIYMTLKNDQQVVVVKSQVFLDDARLFQYTESRHRLDKFRFIDFARREHQ
ncbi:trehalose operon repressor [Terrilactibacillus sp. BCM23-1]|uniref:Trehalose operon repressor n=1 Tax=Terrilactibacillus tamarindi TaxID=2599694 RepID=A0A6N8CNL2_9BACI|nr:trehalose operon repressor [Terrilactibacillus tamarindi]MTT30797.1 trehalose operon repressor [Terrilactibacillus tamarindi]